MLLDHVMTDDVGGLDSMFLTMVRSKEGETAAGGELNEGVLKYLDDTIREQKRKVE